MALAKQVDEARAELLERIDGGPHIEYRNSLRGRLHALEGDSIAAKAASQALSEAQRERRLAADERHSSKRDRVKVWVQLVGVIVAGFAVALPYVLHLAG